jgi:hypothetical protein
MAALHGVYYTKGYHTDLDTSKSIFAFSFGYKGYDYGFHFVITKKNFTTLRRTKKGLYQTDGNWIS